MSSAQSLIANFPETPEGKQAQQLIPELEKAAAYDAMGQQWRYDRSDEGMSGKAVVSAQVISFFQLEVIVGAVIIKDVLAPLHNLLTVLIEFGLDKIVFLCKNGKRAINVM